MLKVPNFTLPQLEKIRKYGNLTERESEILELRNCDCPPTIENIAEMWHCSPSTVSRTIKSLARKVINIL